MTDPEYAEHLGKVIEAYTSLMAAALRGALEDQVNDELLGEGLAASIFEATGKKLQESLAIVDAQLQEGQPSPQ